jgi:hypothetical protein
MHQQDNEEFGKFMSKALGLPKGTKFNVRVLAEEAPSEPIQAPADYSTARDEFQGCSSCSDCDGCDEQFLQEDEETLVEGVATLEIEAKGLDAAGFIQEVERMIREVFTTDGKLDVTISSVCAAKLP